MNKIEQWLATRHDVGLLLLRLFIGLRLLYGVIDNILSWDKMMEFSKFLSAQGFPVPTASAVISVYAQFVGGLLILIGYKIRFASAIIAVNFVVALLMVHLHDSIEGMTPALAMLFGALTFLFCGPGKYSVDKK